MLASVLAPDGWSERLQVWQAVRRSKCHSARGSTWHIAKLCVRLVDCCRDSGREEWTGPREQGEVAGKGSCEETGLTNAITPRFSDLNNRLQPRVPIAESFCEMIRDKSGFGNDPPGRRGPCLAWISEPSHDLRRHGMAVASVDPHCLPSWVIEDRLNSCTGETFK